MKLLLAITLFLGVSAYSQDTTKIPTPIAKLVIKDLIDYDAHKSFLSLSKDEIRILEKKIIAKDSIISVFGLKEINYVQQIDAEKSKTVIWQQQYEEAKKLYKKEKLKRQLERIASLCIMGTIGYFYINK